MISPCGSLSICRKQPLLAPTLPVASGFLTSIARPELVEGRSPVADFAQINHRAWFLRLEHNCVDLYPRVWKKLGKDGVPNRENDRMEMMKAAGYFMTESSGHLSEYLPYFRHRRDLQDLFGGPGIGNLPIRPA